MPRLTPRDGVTFQTTDEGGMLLDVAGDRLYGLNAPAAVAWETFAAGGDVDQAVTAVLDRFDIDPDTVRADIDTLVAALLQRGLLTEVAE